MLSKSRDGAVHQLVKPEGGGSERKEERKLGKHAVDQEELSDIPMSFCESSEGDERPTPTLYRRMTPGGGMTRRIVEVR